MTTSVDNHMDQHNKMELFSPTRDLHTCLYADDLAAIGRQSQIVKCIKILKTWSSINEVKINLRKSKLL